MILLQVVGDTVLVFDLEHVRALRELGIVGVLVGTLPRAPQQNVFLGLPLQLSVYETCWLVSNGHALLVDSVKYNEYVASQLTLEEVNGRCRVQILPDSQLLYAVTPDIYQIPGNDKAVAFGEDFSLGTKSSLLEDHAETEDYTYYTTTKDNRYISDCEHNDVNYRTVQDAETKGNSWKVIFARCGLNIQEFLGRQNLPEDFTAKFSAFSHLRNNHYYMMPGLRFGGIFVAYPGDPLQFHSHLIVKVIGKDKRVNLLELVTSGRLATAVKKAWVLMGEEPASNMKSGQTSQLQQIHDSYTNEPTVTAAPMRAFSIEWAGFG